MLFSLHDNGGRISSVSLRSTTVKILLFSHPPYDMDKMEKTLVFAKVHKCKPGRTLITGDVALI